MQGRDRSIGYVFLKGGFSFMNIDERLDNIEFRMDLLFDGTELSRYLYECKITRDQMAGLYEVMNGIREELENHENVSSAEYEARVLDVVGRERFDYHFCEEFAKLLWEEKSYEEIFSELYGDSEKYAYLFNEKTNIC